MSLLFFRELCSGPVKMSRKSSLAILHAALPSCRQQVSVQLAASQKQFFRISINQQTDGVYKALTEMRVRTPWIEALRQSRESSSPNSMSPPEPVKPDLTPKRMSDSYFRCVCLSFDDLHSWLNHHSDTASSSGPMAARHLRQLFWPDTLRNVTHGP